MKQVNPVWGQDYDRGFVGFSNCTSNLISKGITWFENLEESMNYGKDLLDGGISHVFFVWDKNYGIESAKDGVQFFNLQARIADPTLRVVFREPEVPHIFWIEYLAQLLKHAQSMEGTPYDYSGLVGYILKVISPLHHIIPAINKLPVPLNLGGEFCSAYVADCQKHTEIFQSIQLFREYHVTRISPNMLWNRFPWKLLRFDKTKEEV